MRRFLAIDCGSTTTKATLFSELPDGKLTILARAEVPTTVEAPAEDVTLGARAAVAELERQVAFRLQDTDAIFSSRQGDDGVDGFYATSSAGGGLQMVVAGVMKNLTAVSAERAALGAGAIVADVIAIDDGRLPHERLQRIFELRPDMVLISGGVDGGNIAHVIELGELFYAAGIRPRFAPASRLPIIFAGNKQARQYITDILGGKADLRVVENLRPVMEEENSGPARAEIQDAFMNHVMLHAPEYRRLSEWVTRPILPTPAAVGHALERWAAERQVNLLACDIGGATTDIFSVLDGVLNRTVSANLGMSYSINNVLAQAGLGKILSLVPFPLDEDELQDFLANKMVRPTSLPETISDLLVEQVMARLAISLSLQHHKQLVAELRGVHLGRPFGEIFHQLPRTGTKVNMLAVDAVIGSGSVLSLAPRREQACLVLMDSFQPEGITDIYLDSQFLLPHVGAIATGQPEIAWEILHQLSIVHLGVCIAPVGPLSARHTVLGKVEFTTGNLERVVYIPAGELCALPLPDEELEITVTPAPGFNAGAGVNRPVQKLVTPGKLGLLLDGRGRPLQQPKTSGERQQFIVDAYRSMGAFSEENLQEFQRRGGAGNA